jgi:hypothetical protein
MERKGVWRGRLRRKIEFTYARALLAAPWLFKTLIQFLQTHLRLLIPSYAESQTYFHQFFTQLYISIKKKKKSRVAQRTCPQATGMKTDKTRTTSVTKDMY